MVPFFPEVPSFWEVKNMGFLIFWHTGFFHTLFGLQGKFLPQCAFDPGFLLTGSFNYVRFQEICFFSVGYF